MAPRRSSSSSSSTTPISGEISVKIEQEIDVGTSCDGNELDRREAVDVASISNGNRGINPSGISTSELKSSTVEKPCVDKSEPTSGQLKLERSKTEAKRQQNILAKEIFNDKISVQQMAFHSSSSLKLLNRIATVKDDGTVEFEVPGDVEPEALGFGTDDACNTVVDDEAIDAIDLQYITPLQIVMLIVGTRGDVQPFIAIGKRLQDYGH